MEFKKLALGFSGCDGGDIGSPQKRAVWLCGIEWGCGHDAQFLLEDMGLDYSSPPPGYNNWNKT